MSDSPVRIPPQRVHRPGAVSRWPSLLVLWAGMGPANPLLTRSITASRRGRDKAKCARARHASPLPGDGIWRATGPGVGANDDSPLRWIGIGWAARPAGRIHPLTRLRFYASTVRRGLELRRGSSGGRRGRRVRGPCGRRLWRLRSRRRRSRGGSGGPCR